jgi:hypothetical protein
MASASDLHAKRRFQSAKRTGFGGTIVPGVISDLLEEG